VFQVITSNAVQQICRRYLGPVFRLKCHRVYRTRRGFIEHPWHTDNKAFGEKTDDQGLAFIVYLQNTDDGATELVRGSHKFSKAFQSSVFTQQTIQRDYSDKIVHAAGDIGDLVLSDIKTIHRGSHWKNEGSERVSLWFQVDRNLEDAERLLVNPSFLPEAISSDLSRFLGFGMNADMPVEPENCGIATMPFASLVKLTLKAGFSAASHPLAKARRLMPESLKMFARRVFRRRGWN
jgi:hypothetical protein